MEMSNYEDYDALDLAQLVADKAITPLELLDNAILRVERCNQHINAIVTKMYEQATQSIEQSVSSGCFAGVPFLLKDLGITYNGVPTTQGSCFYKTFLPNQDSEIVKRFKKAGLVIFGKTNTPELGLSYTTESTLYGPCRNPWDLNLTAGGSSGGAAAAVAARILPIAHASDGGGSIRVPASCCGLFGLKPTRARVPSGPIVGEVLSGLGTNHAISITVRDSAALLDAICGYEVGDPYCAPSPETSYLEVIKRTPRKLKIAFSALNGENVAIDPAVKEAHHHAINLCNDLGHIVEEASPEYEYELMQRAFRIIMATNVRLTLNTSAYVMKKNICMDELEPLTQAIYLMADQYSATDYASALLSMHNQSRKIAHFFQHYDILLTPSVAKPPLPLGVVNGMFTNIEQYFHESNSFSPYTWIYNMTGQPAMSVPLYWTKTHLPIGVQFVGKFGDEATLLCLARQLELANPWRHRKPTWVGIKNG